jgi:hypothetical protein
MIGVEKATLPGRVGIQMRKRTKQSSGEGIKARRRFKRRVMKCRRTPHYGRIGGFLEF